MSFTDLLGRILAEHFICPIHIFGNALAAEQALPRLNAAVLVTDYYMPHLDGFELIRRVGELPSPPACLLITGHAFDRDEVSPGKVSCFKDILPKPFRWQELARLIEAHWPGDESPPLREDAIPLHGGLPKDVT